MSVWQGRAALVSGASRGIGRAVALALAREGCRVALLARDERALREVAEQCPGSLVLVADLTEPAAPEAAAGEALEAFGHRLDLLANVAGSALRRARLEELEDADWEAQLALHLLGPVRLQRCCRPALAAAGGSIVNVSSIAAGRAAPLGAAYQAAKAALVALTRSTALEWARDGIRANVVEPGYVATDFNAPLVEAGLEERLLRRVPTGRPIAPEAVAEAVLFLGSPENADVTGSVLRIDGGWTARL